MNFLGQGFQKSAHLRQTDRQTQPNSFARRIRGW